MDPQYVDKYLKFISYFLEEYHHKQTNKQT